MKVFITIFHPLRKFHVRVLSETKIVSQQQKSNLPTKPFKHFLKLFTPFL